MEDCVDSIDAEVLLGGGCLAGWLAGCAGCATGRQAFQFPQQKRIESDLKERRLCARCPCQVRSDRACADVTRLCTIRESLPQTLSPTQNPPPPEQPIGRVVEAGQKRVWCLFTAPLHGTALGSTGT